MDCHLALKNGDVNQLIDLLSLIVDNLKNDRSISGYLSAAVQYMNPIMNRTDPFDSKPLVVGPDKGLGFLVSYQLQTIYSARIKRALFDEPQLSNTEILTAIDDLRDLLIEYHPYKGKCFSSQKIYALLKKADAINCLNVISQQYYRLYVVCVPYMHKYYNSHYLFHSNMILSSIPRAGEDIGHPDYIFMHELGHAFHNKLTDGAMTVPESFLPVLRLCFQTDFLQSDDAMAKFREIFADCFSVAVANSDEKLYRSNPFCPVFDLRDQKLISFYFSEISNLANLEQARSAKRFWTKKRKNVFKEIYDQ